MRFGFRSIWSVQTLFYAKRIMVYAEVVSSEKNLGFKGFELIKDCNDKFDFPLLTTYN